MYTFIVSILLLILGYILYGSFVEKVFKPDKNAVTPAYAHNDGVDYLPMPTWKVFLIQFLNIAGTGPIFGAIQGILFGPAAYIWIVIGCIFGGAVHDFMSGAISLRKDGASLPEIIGDELGGGVRMFMRVISLVLLILVGAVFTSTPAGLLADMTSGVNIVGTPIFWSIAIIAYYLLATLLPIDKIIGRFYPLFGLVLLFMAVAVFLGILTHSGPMPEITEAFTNHHPKSSLPLFPGICITIACGAVSGFHATQSPLMARCLKNESLARPIFYGSMITEGFVALIWAAAAIKFVGIFGAEGATPYEQLWNAMTGNGTHGVNPAIIVNGICHHGMGAAGAVLAILGVVAAPITSGDTALRSARLITADFLHVKQNKPSKRLLITLPLFAIVIVLMFVDFQVLWRYFAWFNQTLAAITLWAVTMWLARQRKRFVFAHMPALFMTMVTVSYICVAPEGFRLSPIVSYIIGAVVTVGLQTAFNIWYHRFIRTDKSSSNQ